MRIELDSAQYKVRAAEDRLTDVTTKKVADWGTVPADATDQTSAELWSPPDGGEHFMIDSQKPWDVHLRGPDGKLIKPPANTTSPLPPKSNVERIADAVMLLPAKTVKELHAKAQQDQRFKTQLADPNVDTAVFKKIDMAFKRRQAALKSGVRLAAKEVTFKGKEAEKAQDAALKLISSPKPTGKKLQELQIMINARKERNQKSNELAIKVDREGMLEVDRNRDVFQVTDSKPSEKPTINGVPLGPEQYAAFKNAPGMTRSPSALADMAIGGLTNNPEFQEWVQAKSVFDVIASVDLRKKAYEEYMSQQQIAALATGEVQTVTERLLAKAAALMALTQGMYKTQNAGKRRFESEATGQVLKWTKDMEQLAAGIVECSRPDCRKDTWLVWQKTQKLIVMINEAQRQFDDWSKMMYLHTNDGAAQYKSDTEQVLWASLYEAKDDLHRQIMVTQKELDREKNLESAYEDRLAVEMRMSQIAAAMSVFPVPERIKIPAMVNTKDSGPTSVDFLVDTEAWADCRCPMVFHSTAGFDTLHPDDADQLTCPYCANPLWEKSDIYKKFSSKSIRTNFEKKQIRWGVMPRHSTIVCDLEEDRAKKTGKCVYKCDWENLYGSNWYSAVKGEECKAKPNMSFEDVKQCKNTYVELPTTSADGYTGGMCEATMSLRSLFNREDKKINGEPGTTTTSTPLKTPTSTPLKTPTSTPLKTPTSTPLKTPTSTSLKNGIVENATASLENATASFLEVSEGDKPGEYQSNYYTGPIIDKSDIHENKKTAKLAATADRKEKVLNKIFDESKTDYSQWFGWKCVRQTGKGTVWGYQCSFNDLSVGYIGVKGARRADGEKPARQGGGVCVKWKRVRPEMRSICSCCPTFVCNDNCQKTYDLQARYTFDSMHDVGCLRKHFDDPVKKLSCINKMATRKTVVDANNIVKGLSLRTPLIPYDASELDSSEKLELIPIWKKVRDKFGSDMHTGHEASEWFCKIQWKYSALDLNETKLDPVQAQRTGWCNPTSDDGKIHDKDTAHTVQCQKSVVTNYVVSRSPYQTGRAQFAINNDRPPGVLWPPQDPPPSMYPSRNVAPDIAPSRFKYCTGCCQQLYPKKLGCPKSGLVLDTGGKFSSGDLFPLTTLKPPGPYEWEIVGQESKIDAVDMSEFLTTVKDLEHRAFEHEKKEEEEDEADNDVGEQDLLSPVSLVQVGEGNVATSHTSFEEQIQPNVPLNWDESPWGRRRVTPKPLEEFARRRRRYFNTPVERAAKTARNAAQIAVDSSNDVMYKVMKEEADAGQQKSDALHVKKQEITLREMNLAHEVKDTTNEKLQKRIISQEDYETIIAQSEKNAKAKSLQEYNEIKTHWDSKMANFNTRLAEKRLLYNMARGKLKQVLTDTAQVRTEMDEKMAEDDVKTDVYIKHITKKFKEEQALAKKNWEMIGLAKDAQSKISVQLMNEQTAADKLQYEKNEIAQTLKEMKKQLDDNVPLRPSDIKAMELKSISDLDKMSVNIVNKLKEELKLGWDNLVGRTRIRMIAGKLSRPTIHVTATIFNLKDKMVQKLREKYEAVQCNSKAIDAYYRLLVEEEVGYIDTRGRSFATPKCERLKSIHQSCDAGFVKECTTLTRDTVDTGLNEDYPYKCEKYSDGKAIDLEKSVFCPRITKNNMNDASTECQVKRSCSQGSPGGDAAPISECALF